MGYYTNFTVEVTSDSRAAAEAAAEALAQKSGYSADMFERTSFGIYDSKWYEWEKDTAEVSKNHPGVVFYINGEGEESGDIWKAWAYAGEVSKSQAKMTFDEPEWLPRAVNSASAIVATVSVAEMQAIEEAERAELARLQAKYGDNA